MEAELFINIENFNGEKFQIIALENDNINTLKLLIFAQSHRTISGCDFLINGQTICESTQTLKELNIQNGDILTIQKRNTVMFNIPGVHHQYEDNESSQNSSIEISYFSDDNNNNNCDNDDFGDLQLNKGFSFAPTLKRQYFCGY